MDLVADVEFAEAFFDRLTDTIITAQEKFLAEVGDLIDVHFAADDLAGQYGPLLSPAAWRALVKPRQARIMAAIRAGTRAPIFYHSCGAVVEFLPDLVEIGVQVLNPVQVAAAGMDTRALKRRFGKELSFWGGGCDTQQVLPYGTAAQVREEVRRRIADLAPGGGFVFTPVHNIQPGVPVENVRAAYAAARENGAYPVERRA
jgi:uroporphyrinogen decarboxylase